MTALLAILLFGTAFLVSAWSLVASIRPQIHRYRALFAAAPELPAAAPIRIRPRAPVPARRCAHLPLRAAA